MPDVGIEICEMARDVICKLATRSTDGMETGGILLGRGPEPDGLIAAEIAGDPGPKAIRKADYFLRDLEHAQGLAMEAWDTSRAVWIGEWHTHLNGSPAPSTSDLGTYLRLLAASELAFTHFLSIIVTDDGAGDWMRPELSPWVMELDSGSDRVSD